MNKARSRRTVDQRQRLLSFLTDWFVSEAEGPSAEVKVLFTRLPFHHHLRGLLHTSTREDSPTIFVRRSYKRRSPPSVHLTMEERNIQPSSGGGVKGFYLQVNIWISAFFWNYYC